MRIVVVEGTATAVRRAKERGWTVFVITREARAEEFAVPPDLVVDRYGADFVEAAISVIGGTTVDAVISLSEEGLVPAALLRARLGVPGGNNVQIVTALRDKARMRSLLSAFPGLAIRHQSIFSAAELPAALASVGIPAVVKPSHGSGSNGVYFVRGEHDLGVIQSTLWQRGRQELLVEELLTGPEFSVETFTTQIGEHYVCGVTDKLTDDGGVEIGHSSPTVVPEVHRSAIVSLVRRFLDTIGFEWGPAHTEVILTEAGPRIVESHDRIGGDKIRDLTTHAYGVDLLELTLDLLAGEVCHLRDPEPIAGAAIRFLFAPAGLVTTIRLPDSVPDSTAVVLQTAVGQVIRPLLSSSDRAGYVVTYASDVGIAVSECLQVMSSIRIDTTSDQFSAS